MQPAEQTTTHQIKIDLRPSDAQLIREFNTIVDDHLQQSQVARGKGEAIMLSAIRAAETPLGEGCSYRLAPDGCTIIGIVPGEPPTPGVPPADPPPAPPAE